MKHLPQSCWKEISAWITCTSREVYSPEWSLFLQAYPTTPHKTPKALARATDQQSLEELKFKTSSKISSSSRRNKTHSQPHYMKTQKGDCKEDWASKDYSHIRCQIHRRNPFRSWLAKFAFHCFLYQASRYLLPCDPLSLGWLRRVGKSWGKKQRLRLGQTIRSNSGCRCNVRKK